MACAHNGITYNPGGQGIMAQHSVKKGLEIFGKARVDAVLKGTKTTP
jgi:hypothetical protein